MTNTPAEAVRILVPTGMLGAGFPESSVRRGLALGADVIAVDGGSTDSGPYYLGASKPKTSAAAVTRDLSILLDAAAEADIPLIVGSCGTSGTDDGVDWIAGIVDQLIAEKEYHLPVARIYSEQRIIDLKGHLDAGRIHALPPLGDLTAETLESCSHIVGVMGHEPIVEALTAGARVVLTGRATDPALAAAYPLMKGLPAGPAWHAAKIMECGDQCTVAPRGGGVFAVVDASGFIIEPLDPQASCTPISVAAHMLYETVNPFRMREPHGTLDVSEATYTALDSRRVRVEGSRFHVAEQHTVKLEGARITGYETMSFAAIREPHIIERIDEWAEFLRSTIAERVGQTLRLRPDEYAMDIRLYGHNAILQQAEPGNAPVREVGVMLLISAADQDTATAIAKTANPLLLHLPTRDMAYLPSFAFATSPAELERGAAYEFVLHHVVDTDNPTDMFRTEFGANHHG